MDSTTPERQPSGLSERFRKLNLGERRDVLRAKLDVPDAEWTSLCASPHLLDLADLMVESAVGCLPVPVGIATGFLIDGEVVGA